MTESQANTAKAQAAYGRGTMKSAESTINTQDNLIALLLTGVFLMFVFILRTLCYIYPTFKCEMIDTININRS